MSGTVNMRLEHDAVRQNFAQRSQRINLESAAVRENRTSPVHKGMQAAQFADGFMTGPQV
ncbi:MAG: hypothetical protein BWX99_02915 [Deltaproteobacteria bacterium ADurb.Bin151]|nr:MAG: hypothetical protein BWX99_02915 [Deltaproteobacteria bacterium ADurb.Bin151]